MTPFRFLLKSKHYSPYILKNKVLSTMVIEYTTRGIRSYSTSENLTMGDFHKLVEKETRIMREYGTDKFIGPMLRVNEERQ